MLERVAIALALLALFALALWAGKRWYASRNRAIEDRLRDEAAGDASTQKQPRIVYFTTSTCIVCKSQQEPAIAALQAHVDDLIVEQHDAVERADLAKQFGVLSVPTTAVYARSGNLVTINRGFTAAAALRAQIDETDLEFDSGSVMSSEQVT